MLMCSVNPQILTIFDTRREIYDNIQEILGIHEFFLTQLQTASPMSVPQAQQGKVPSRQCRVRMANLNPIHVRHEVRQPG
jgi:hypothetical protein